ncbi:MAG: hypothetical protein IJL69_04200, partial [Oscillospiraceae bacterium]|nr:hypothetical protein [Oscillospiraceae bacterium]
MALRDHKVDTGSDYTGKDVESLPDAPTITAAQLKARFDSLVKKVVVPKYNALIDELGEPAHTVNGAPAGRLAALDGSGDLTDSGVDADGVEPKRRMCFISANPSQLWFRVLKVTLPQSINAARAVRVQGFSGTPNSNGRGHWEVLLSMTYLGNAYRKKCTITFVDKGITPENFDFRETEQGVYALWFKPLASTMYYLFVTEEGDMNGLTVETFDND